ncbi:metallophosphoesterase [Caldithrix abyssi DSM 13497]|uniref:Metallophosphoesterase n=1 Tax=Caldithrix abyssi DSM 13497 TaxID=880073 RepID=H1XQM7_CALAY|nr:UDP-2,3-diacylglucosamine diphosphatase [Caldithrix abyssi]APF17021.1 UDP-2,3-diacylglucosamine hydrolase [Caldithrix abyssi DSM 13497]EHO41173.1 metallophosphoesterase [Caldithrix abyssi DSM 13497]
MKAYFISDLHLGAREIENPELQRERVNGLFAQILKDATHLFVVGDFFDFWFEYKTVIPKQYFPVLFYLQKMREKGIEVHYLAGNHDFFLGTFFDRYLDVKTHADEAVVELKSKRFFIFHGDGVDPDDKGYRILKRILRSAFNQKLFRLIHPDLGIRLAKLVSGTSRKYNKVNLKKRSEDAYVRFAEQKFAEGFDYVVMGHRHNPLVHEAQGKKYVNLGDWIVNYSYAVFDGNDLKLKFFTNQSQRAPK